MSKPPFDDPEFAAREAEDVDEAAEDLRISGMSAALGDRRRLALGALVLVGGVAGIYFVFPKVVGLDEEIARIDDAKWYWIVVAIAFNIAAFGAYVMLFRGILGSNTHRAFRDRLDVRASYQITMAGLAATRIFSAAGAGGLVLTYWALRKAGMPRRLAACRMVAFLTLTYAVYLVALVLFGVLLRTGVLPGADPLSGTIVPAAISGAVILIILLLALVPGDVERSLAGVRGDSRVARTAQRMATGPATVSTGIRVALDYIRHPRQGATAVVGAIGFWAAQIGILWASCEAFGGNVPLAVLVQGFFVGMAANLVPSPAGGVGSVDAGMIGALVLFDVPSEVVFPAVLTYRVIAFWLPIPPGIVAFFQLRRTVAAWEDEQRREDATLQKVK